MVVLSKQYGVFLPLFNRALPNCKLFQNWALLWLERRLLETGKNKIISAVQDSENGKKCNS